MRQHEIGQHDSLIAWMALKVLPPDLEALPPASTRCGPIQSYEGGVSRIADPICSQDSLNNKTLLCLVKFS